MASITKQSRRSLLKQSLAAGAALIASPYIVPSEVLAAPGRAGANDRVNVGYIGVGRRGLQVMVLPKGAHIVAISDVNSKRLDKVGQGKPWKKYVDYRKLLEDRDVDAVVIATPDHWHALNSIHACQAGKDIYCEKPMTLTVREGRAVVEAVRKHKRVFQTGSMQRSMSACRIGCELIHRGLIGKIRVVHGSCYPSPIDKCSAPGEPVPEGLDWDMWCGPTQPRPFNAKLYMPRPHPTGWISYREYSGGEMTGWGSHGLDVIQWALKTDLSGPVEVWPEGKGLKCQVTFRYADGILVKLDSQGPPGGGLFIGEKGKILVDRENFQTWPEEISKEVKEELRHCQWTDHLANWIDCIRTRKQPIAHEEIGHRSATMCHLGNIARWTGRKLKWDPEKEKFIGDDEANALLQRPMRKPYAL